MTPIGFLAEWALRSSILIFGGALLIWAARLKDPAVRLAAWTALLIGSLLIPTMTMSLPALPLRVVRGVAPHTPVTSLVESAVTLPAEHSSAPIAAPFDWYRAGLRLYEIVTAGMLLRLFIGLLMSWRILRRSRRTDRDFSTSRDLASPATLGIVRPIIVLPEDWPTWETAKFDSVLAHERSHIERHDPAVQLFSAIHRSLLWFSPAAWYLHSKIVRAGEEVSDDAAIAVTADRAAYAEILVVFMQRRALPRHYLGVPMSRYGSTDSRIQRILDSSTLSRGITRLGFAAILAAVSPLAYFIATAAPASAAPPPPAASTPTKQTTAPPPARRGPGRNGSRPPQTLNTPPGGFLVGLGTVHGGLVTVRTQVDGALKSVDFQEGQPVHVGDVVAVIEPEGYRDKLVSAALAAKVQAARLDAAERRYAAGTDGIDVKLSAQSAHDAAVQEVENAKARLAATQIKAPVSGIAGLRRVEPGNMVQPTDPDGIVTIVEVQPISVLFTLPEKFIEELREVLYSGKHPIVEAWSNDDSSKIATGVLTAMDNQIDPKTGTVTLKATFDNKNGKLFPNQFVNVHVLK